MMLITFDSNPDYIEPMLARVKRREFIPGLRNEKLIYNSCQSIEENL
jgi:hypothetical protein